MGARTGRPVVLVDDARATATRHGRGGCAWVAPREGRDGSLFATAQDPDGNDVQVIQLSEEAKRQLPG